MKKFIVGSNKYLSEEVVGYYHYDYVGYQQDGNPDFINHLKNMSNKKNEIDLVEDFIKASAIATKDLNEIAKQLNIYYPTICVVPRSKSEKKYKQSQLMFKKVLASIAGNNNFKNGTNAIVRIKDKNQHITGD